MFVPPVVAVLFLVVVVVVVVSGVVVVVGVLLVVVLGPGAGVVAPSIPLVLVLVFGHLQHQLVVSLPSLFVAFSSL